MEKNSFTILETILSISVLSIVISGFSYATYYDSHTLKLYTKLNDLENDFNTNNYSNMNSQIHNITIIKNNTIEENLLIKKIVYEDNDIKLYKYEK
ncbi:hypothetical protein [Poseidonibacter sp.]|uniref:hypothetical protein n=2 Tax=Poseidonibacter sp. TaxID=2321188 RepID=UPI003C773E6C